MTNILNFLDAVPGQLTREKPACLSSPNLPNQPMRGGVVCFMLSMKNTQDEGKRMRILIADDNPEVRSALKLLLEQEPLLAFVVEAHNTEGFLSILNDRCPAVVLLDWELPGLPQNDVFTTLRAYCPDMKVIAMSSQFEARQAALAAGADAFVSKAEPPEKILAALHALTPDRFLI
jgi:CheY-like chemotaxis protein